MRHIVLTCLTVIVALLAASRAAPAQAPAEAAPDTARVIVQAEQAQRSGRPEDAVSLYRKALAAEPGWAEGWWRLGLLLYDRDAYAEAADAFERSASLEPSLGTTWVMRGLSEFQVGRRDEALTHIQHGRRLGTSADPQFRHVMLYHEGLLLLGKAEFERAQETFALLSAEGVEGDDLTVALGLAALRLRPADVPEGDSHERLLAGRAGKAEHLAARKQFELAQAEYESLARDFPTARNVHYALGRYFVATQQPEKAVAAFEREIANTPEHVPARLGIAAIKAETDPAAALPYAEQGVALNPRIPLGHYLLGSLLLHTDQIDRAIAELELAEQAVSQDPGVYYALGRAYARAGRTADAERARARFKQLTEERQKAARGDAQP